MVTESCRTGLIISTDQASTAALDELIVACGWPVLLEATPLRLRRELLFGVPKLSLFWMDDERHVESTVRLLAWLRDIQPGVRRVAVGYRIDAEAEIEVRSAGAHLYLAATNNIHAIVEGSLATWVRGRKGTANESSERTFVGAQQWAPQRPPGVPLHPSGPP